MAMTEFEKAALQELVAIRRTIECIADTVVPPKPDAFSKFMASPSPRTIDEWYESSLCRAIALEVVGEDA